MSNIKAVKGVMLLENLHGLFRRDLFNRKYMKYIVSAIWPLTVLISIFEDFKLELSGACLEMQMFIVNFKTISIILCSTYNSDKLVKITKLIDNFHGLIPRGKSYSVMTKWLNFVVVTTLMFILLLGAAIEYSYWINMPDLMMKCHRKEVVMLIYIELYMADFLAFTEALLYYCLCSVIAYQLDSLSELIRTDMESLQSNFTEQFSLPKQYWKRWGDSYINISDCVELLNSLFGLQITLTFGVTGVYFVYLFQIFLAFKNLQTLFIIYLPQLMTIALTSMAGQVIKNKAVDLRRTLSRAKIKIVEEENEESFNAISSVISLTSGRPIHTHIFGSIATGYAMLPAVFMCFTTPIIMVLQFNV